MTPHERGPRRRNIRHWKHEKDRSSTVYPNTRKSLENATAAEVERGIAGERIPLERQLNEQLDAVSDAIKAMKRPVNN